jgi:hypothetical protein
MKKIYIYISLTILFVVCVAFILFGYFEKASVEVRLYPRNISIYPFEQANITIVVSSSKPIKDLFVTLEKENSSLAGILFPIVKDSTNTSLLLSLNRSSIIKAIPDSIYLYDIKRVTDSIFVNVLQPNMSFFQLPEYKKLEVINLNSKGMRMISYFTSFPLSYFWPYINFSHIENARTINDKSFANIYVQSTLTTKQIADFFSFLYKKNYSKFNQVYFFNFTNSTICILPKQGFTRIIVAQEEDCKNFVDLPSTKSLNNTLNLTTLNITSPYIGEIIDSDGTQAKGFSYQYGYYFVVRYPNKINCSYPFYFENKSFCINSALQSFGNYQFKIINITYENFGFYFFNFNVSVENQIQQFAFSNLLKLTNTTPHFP